jgi:hypothetical protein
LDKWRIWYWTKNRCIIQWAPLMQITSVLGDQQWCLSDQNLCLNFAKGYIETK